MFEHLVVQPIFNLLVLIISFIPGHNFGLALIIFTVLVRTLMWPIVKKQLHHAKEMRELQPEIKRIKKEASGDKKKESEMMMELYKERSINPFGSFGVLIIQFIVLLGLLFGVRKLINDPQSLITFSYSWLHGLPWLQSVSNNIHSFDETLLGFINLTKPAFGSGGWYIPALLLVVGSAFVQYKQSAQLMVKPKDARSLKQIFKDASEGKQTDQMEVNAVVMSNTKYLIPGMVFFFTLGLPSALSLYWLTGGLVAIFQQSKILKQDEEEMEAIANEPAPKRKIIEGEIIQKKTPKNKKPKSSKKRRK